MELKHTTIFVSFRLKVLNSNQVSWLLPGSYLSEVSGEKQQRVSSCLILQCIFLVLWIWLWWASLGKVIIGVRNSVAERERGGLGKCREGKEWPLTGKRQPGMTGRACDQEADSRHGRPVPSLTVMWSWQVTSYF